MATFADDEADEIIREMVRQGQLDPVCGSKPWVQLSAAAKEVVTQHITSGTMRYGRVQLVEEM